MIKKLQSIIDGNTSDVLKLKIKRKFSLINYNIIKNKNIYPIIINNINRLYHLKKQLEYLKSKNIKEIIIIDNQSTYLPLIDYYKILPYKIYRMQKNLGYLSLWKTNLFNKFKKDFYVYTDPDILPVSECPVDFLDYFKSNLIKNIHIEKIGFSLKIDDLPDNDFSSKIIENEKKFWKKKNNDNLFCAPIDTTFAMYRPFCYGGYWLNSLRTNTPYIARHLTWYNDNDEDEDKFYNEDIIKNSSFYANHRFKNY
jgi:hypothetical protein